MPGDGLAGWRDRRLAALVSGWSPRSTVTTVVSVLGLGVSTYLTIAHYQGGASLTCPLGSANGVIDCAKVTTSPESMVFGIPVALLGLLFFIPMLLLSLPGAWRSPHALVAPARMAAAVVGIGFVFYLLYSELFTIHAICIWCTTVHFLTFVLFVTVVTGWDEAREPYLLTRFSDA